MRCDQNTKLVPLLGVRTLLGLGESKDQSKDYVEPFLGASQPFLLIWVSFFAVGLGWPHPARPRVENFLETHPPPLFTPCELTGCLRDGHMPRVIGQLARALPLELLGMSPTQKGRTYIQNC